jgi:hypothetical protein
LGAALRGLESTSRTDSGGSSSEGAIVSISGMLKIQSVQWKGWDEERASRGW